MSREKFLLEGGIQLLTLRASAHVTNHRVNCRQLRDSPLRPKKHWATATERGHEGTYSSSIDPRGRSREASNYNNNYVRSYVVAAIKER